MNIVSWPKGRRGTTVWSALAGLLVAGAALAAQPEDPKQKAEFERFLQGYKKIPWQVGPCKVVIAGVAELNVPEGYQFTGPQGAATWAEINQNPPSETHGVLMPKDDFDWFVDFRYDACGHVADDEKDKLDADAILKSLQAGTEQSNAYRRSKGWPELHVTGWMQPPSYDPATQNLIWAARCSDGTGGEGTNYQTRLLGRGGVMHVTLVTDAESLQRVLPTVKGVYSGFQFQSGQKYAEFRPGDKTAMYGLTGLITGGAVVGAAKAGLLGKLAALIAKGGKAIFLAIAALVGMVWKFLTGRGGKKAGE